MWAYFYGIVSVHIFGILYPLLMHDGTSYCLWNGGTQQAIRYKHLY